MISGRDRRAAREGKAAVRCACSPSARVVLAGAAFNTPQLLRLSGIGPRTELEQHGISVFLDAPGVGENPQDRYEVAVVSQRRRDFEILADAGFDIPAPGVDDPLFDEWERRDGPDGKIPSSGSHLLERDGVAKGVRAERRGASSAVRGRVG